MGDQPIGRTPGNMASIQWACLCRAENRGTQGRAVGPGILHAFVLGNGSSVLDRLVYLQPAEPLSTDHSPWQALHPTSHLAQLRFPGGRCFGLDGQPSGRALVDSLGWSQEAQTFGRGSVTMGQAHFAEVGTGRARIAHRSGFVVKSRASMKPQ